MGAAIEVNFLGSVVEGNPLGEDDAGNWFGALIVDGYLLGPACEPVDHRKDRLGIGADQKRAITTDNVDVQRRKWLIGGKTSESCAGI